MPELRGLGYYSRPNRALAARLRAITYGFEMGLDALPVRVLTESGFFGII